MDLNLLLAYKVAWNETRDSKLYYQVDITISNESR